MPEDFDPAKEFESIDKVMQNSQKEGWNKMKKIISEIFEANSILSDPENLAVAQDITAHSLGFRADNIVALWFTEWKIKKLGGNK